MSENASTHPVPDYGEIWGKLTYKQQAFVQGVLAGKSKPEAYRDAYDVSPEAKRHSVNTNAYIEGSKPLVALAIQLGREKAINFTRKEHDQALMRIALKAENEGKHGAAIQAYQVLGKAAGLYIEQHKDVTETDPMETLQTIAQSAPELAEAIANQLGLNYEGTKH